MESRLIILGMRCIAVITCLPKLNITQVKNCSHNSKNCILQMESFRKPEVNYAIISNNKSLLYLLLGADSNYLHGPPCSQIFFGIINTVQFIAIRLVQIMKIPWILQFVFFNILLESTKDWQVKK